MIIMGRSGNVQNFFITANSLKRQRQLGTNSVVIERVDCITFNYLFELITKIRFSNNSFEFIN